MPTGKRPRLRAIRAFGDEAGSAAVEFALTSVPFLGFVLAIFQVALYHFAAQSLDDATRTASRSIMTGGVQAQALTVDQFRANLLCPALKMPLDCARVGVSISKVGKRGSAQNAPDIDPYIDASVPALKPANLDPNQRVYCLGGPGDFLFVDVTYSFLNVGGFIQSITGAVAGNAVTLRSTNLVANEPFQVASGSTQAGC
ncbi:TadE/TadG family type IV pilus assembly protein [Methylobacterium nigriterrae]|uniref:TadE/TadG family type IV pilus assembly protein n=1 Tax=Methylobacterium nigriterrae TaxID=3127512 RepID=UPI003013B6A2